MGRDITAEADRAAGSFYNHFTSKEDLLKALLTDLFAEGDEAALAPESRHSEDFTDRAAVRWHVAAYWRFHTKHIGELTALRQAALINPDFGAQLEAMVSDNTSHLRDHLDYITRAGRTLPGDPGLVLAMFSGLLDGFSYRWQVSAGEFSGRSVTDDEAIEALTDFLHRALKGHPEQQERN